VQLSPEHLVEAGTMLAGVVGVLILVAPNFGLKPTPTADGWKFPVKPTCLLLYLLALCVGVAAVGFGSSRLLANGTSDWTGWVCFAFGVFVVPLVLADWPEPLILDGEGLLERGYTAGRIRWQELVHVRQYRVRCDRGVVIHAADGKMLVVAEMAYDSEAVLDRLLQWRSVPYYSLKDGIGAVSILGDHHTQF
jgi:hypothetical protein